MHHAVRALAVLLLGAAPLAAQDAIPITHGTVRDFQGRRLADALVRVRGRDAVSRTTAEGRFAVRGEAGEWLVVARIGYAPDSTRIGSGPAEFRLRAAPLTLAALTVVGAEASTASERSIRALDLALRPHESSQDLLRLAPGLVIAQHAGGGKAEHIFLRGFDADHGTDVAVTVDGTPVNLVSHAHGQGYADLHFLLPEVVEGIDVRKGPYDVRDGNLATAGAVAFTTRDRLARGSVEARGGSFGAGSTRVLLPFGGDAATAGGYVAAALARTDGPFRRPQDYRRGNVFARFTTPVTPHADVVATLSAFDARWDASGQLPARAVASGRVDRFGALDPTEGGRTARAEASIALRSRDPERRWQLRAYAVGYRFDLFSDFTFFLEHPEAGDGIAQRDRRTVLGGEATLERGTRLFGTTGTTTLLAGVRHDAADVRLADQTRRTIRDVRVASAIDETHLFGAAQHTLHLGDRVRLGLGLRGDLFRASVRDRTPDAQGIAGRRTVAIASPKARLAVDAGRGTTLFVDIGAGFHSNDARDVVQAPAGARVLPRAVAAELGARRTWSHGSVAIAAWALDLQSELVFVGDEGVTEASGRTRRQGLDLEGRLRLTRWLWADADVSLSRGRFRDEPADADRIPLAPTRIATAGLTVRDAGPFGAAFRVRHVGSRPADERGDIVARGHLLTDLSARCRVGRAEVALTVDNLFDVAWNEAQFATTSRLRDEPAPVTELHFTPGAPRAVQAGVRIDL